MGKKNKKRSSMKNEQQSLRDLPKGQIPKQNKKPMSEAINESIAQNKQPEEHTVTVNQNEENTAEIKRLSPEETTNRALMSRTCAIPEHFIKEHKLSVEILDMGLSKEGLSETLNILSNGYFNVDMGNPIKDGGKEFIELLELVVKYHVGMIDKSIFNPLYNLANKSKEETTMNSKPAKMNFAEAMNRAVHSSTKTIPQYYLDNPEAAETLITGLSTGFTWKMLEVSLPDCYYVADNDTAAAEEKRDFLALLEILAKVQYGIISDDILAPLRKNIDSTKTTNVKTNKEEEMKVEKTKETTTVTKTEKKEESKFFDQHVKVGLMSAGISLAVSAVSEFFFSDEELDASKMIEVGAEALGAGVVGYAVSRVLNQEGEEKSTISNLVHGTAAMYTAKATRKFVDKFSAEHAVVSEEFAAKNIPVPEMDE